MSHQRQTGVGLKGCAEHDALSGWRRLLACRPGERKAAKTTFNQHVRHQRVEADTSE